MLEVIGGVRTRTFRVLWLLEELGIEYKHRDVDFSKGDHKDPEFLKINPSAKVPVLRVEDKIYHETSMMLWLIADKYGKGSHLEIPNDGSQYEILQWLFYGADELEQGLWTVSRHKFVLPKEERIEANIQWGYREFSKCLDYLHLMLGEKLYLVNDKFSIADLQIAQILLWGFRLQVDLKYGNVREFMDRIRGRESFKRTLSKIEKN